jgi:hypothetical protein
VVGLVTKYAGGVVKGFALIAGTCTSAIARFPSVRVPDCSYCLQCLAGILVTGLAQFLVDGKPLGPKDL